MSSNVLRYSVRDRLSGSTANTALLILSCIDNEGVLPSQGFVADVPSKRFSVRIAHGHKSCTRIGKYCVRIICLCLGSFDGKQSLVVLSKKRSVPLLLS